MALLAAAAVARRASALLRPAAVIRRMSSSSDSAASLRAEAASYLDKAKSLRAEAASFRAEAASLRAEAASYLDKAESLRAEIASYLDKADVVHRASSHDGELIRAIESAVQSNERSLADEIPSDFPFEISDEDGLTDITLTRSFKGEQIEVMVSVPTRDQDEEEDEYTSDSDQDENDPKEVTVPLTVTVSKADGSSLEFLCTAYPDKIDIDDLSMKPAPSQVASDEDEEVVEFSELDENLQQSLHMYLELRGIKPVYMKILHEHMVSKDRRRHLPWLAKLRDFVKKD